jgi:hypothetical protein
MYTVYDRVYGNLPAKHTIYTVYTYVCMVLANPSFEWPTLAQLCMQLIIYGI